MTINDTLYSLGILVIVITVAQAQSTSQATTGGTVPITVDNFARAESDLYMGNAVKDAGGTG